MTILYEFIDLCIDNFTNGGHSSDKVKEHRYHDLKHIIIENEKKVKKINEILEITEVGWANPKVLIDTLKRVQKEIDNE